MTENEDRGDILIRGQREKGADCILYIGITYTDAPAYQMKDPSKVLEAAEYLKQKINLQPCLNQHHYSTPFIMSVDGLIGKEAKTVLKVLAARTDTKSGNT
jgi:hypothetical protein